MRLTARSFALQILPLALSLCGSVVIAQQAARDLFVTAGKSLVVESPTAIERVSLASPDVADALVVNPRELLIHGKQPGLTSLLVWQQGGTRLLFDLTVRPNTTRSESVLESLRRELARELPGETPAINLTMENNTIFVRGLVPDVAKGERVMNIVRTGGTAVNLLNVAVPPTEAQILLKVRFADVDRGASLQLGANFFSTGAGNTIGSLSTGQFQSGRIQADNSNGGNVLTLTDALNIFLFRPDYGLATTIRALQGQRLLEILAEPNVLAYNGRPASFLAGGEFPYPTLQGGGGGLGAVTIAFREFGVRLNFTPTITPRGTIHLQVQPEVSTLDYANGLTFQGFTIPGIASRRVQTEIELEAGQSFAIGGLLDNRVTQSLSKIPGIGDIPFFGRLFRSKDVNRNKTELIVIVTPEIVRPLPKGKTIPDLERPLEFLKEGGNTMPRHPGLEETGPVPVTAPNPSVPFETLAASPRNTQPASPAAAQIQFVPMLVPPAQPSPALATPPPAAQPQAPAAPPAKPQE